MRHWLNECWKRRKTAVTSLNDVSSRSHAVCTIHMEASTSGVRFSSDAHIIDLAGEPSYYIQADLPPLSLACPIFLNPSPDGCQYEAFRGSY